MISSRSEAGMQHSSFLNHAQTDPGSRSFPGFCHFLPCLILNHTLRHQGSISRSLSSRQLTSGSDPIPGSTSRSGANPLRGTVMRGRSTDTEPKMRLILRSALLQCLILNKRVVVVGHELLGCLIYGQDIEVLGICRIESF